MSYISIRPKRRKKKEYEYLSRLANIIFKKSKNVIKGYWKANEIDIDKFNLCYKNNGFENNLKKFLNTEKRIIDDYITKNPYNEINFIEKTDFIMNIKRIKLYNKLNKIKKEIKELPNKYKLD